jgi:hypothetical protein
MILALLILLAGVPADAESLPVVAWELEVKACGKGGNCHALMRRNMGSESACDLAAAKLVAEVPGTPSSWYGFPAEEEVTVRPACVIRRGAELDA